MEIWKDIKDYEGKYQVSNLGKVKSLNYKNSGKEQILKLCEGKNGYLVVNLCKNLKCKTYSVHKLVAIAFLNHEPNGYSLVVDHISACQTDNRLENLQIVTSRENVNRSKVCKNKTSNYIGVSFRSDRNKWRAAIGINGSKKNLGNFKTELEATEAYQKALKNI